MTRVGPRRTGAGGPAFARVLLIAIAVGFLGLCLLLPLGVIFAAAFEQGASAYVEAIVRSDTVASIRLTLITAAIAVPLNTGFGVAAAWLLSKYEFRGKSLLLTLVDLPFSISPVISGLLFVLLFGAKGTFGPWLAGHGIEILFSLPAIVITTTFITFPLVCREVLAVMQAQGSDEEEAALTLGASGLQVFFRITLPKIRWGFLYGVILCNARAMGEFGAVSVVSGHIRGETNTMPLQVEILYNEYSFVGAFAVATLLTLLALSTLVAKAVVEWSLERAGKSQSE